MFFYWVAVGVVGYLCGSFPTGYLAARLWRGVDIRKVGSGRTGGTNVLRVAGIGPAVITVLGDVAKAYLAVWLARWLVGTPLASAIAGVAAVFGHNHSLFLGGTGGAGSMCTVGVLIAFSPAVAALAGTLSLVPTILFRIASVGSITLALLSPLLLLGGALLKLWPLEYSVGALLISAQTLYELRPNIRRLLAGTERKISKGAA